MVDDEQLVRRDGETPSNAVVTRLWWPKSGPTAIDIFKRYPGQIALVLLDLSMPKMNGEEALPELNKIRPGVKVVVSSGYSEA